MIDDTDLGISGGNLRCGDVVRVARGGARVELSGPAVARVEQAYLLAVELGAKRAVYGRTTGVGANRQTAR
jgi:histidine ammonia-lyase